MRIFTIAFFLCGFIINAQNYSYKAVDYKNGVPSAMVGVPGDQFKCTLTFSNTSSGNVYIHVQRSQKSIPSYWSVWYHYLQPKSPSQDTITLKLSPSSSSVLTLHIKTDSVNPGVATATFKMFQVGYPDDADVYYLNASTIKSTVGIQSVATSSDVRIFPNPAQHLLNITSGEKNITAIVIYDALGVEKFKMEKAAQLYSVDFSQYAAGVYFVKVSYDNTSILQKIIKN